MLHFYHHPHSPYSRKVFFLLEELGQVYDLKVVGLESGEQKSTEYLSINPAGRVPAIKDGEFQLFESNAILRYLVRKFDAKHLYPTSLKEQAVVDQWWEFCSVHINKPLIDLAWNKIMVQKYGGKSDDVVIQKAEKNLRRDLPVLEKQLTGRDHLASIDLSLADINLMPFAVYAPDVIGMNDYPAFLAWIQRVAARTSWKTVVTYSGR